MNVLVLVSYTNTHINCSYVMLEWVCTKTHTLLFELWNTDTIDTRVHRSWGRILKTHTRYTFLYGVWYSTPKPYWYSITIIIKQPTERWYDYKYAYIFKSNDHNNQYVILSWCTSLPICSQNEDSRSRRFFVSCFQVIFLRLLFRSGFQMPNEQHNLGLAQSHILAVLATMPRYSKIYRGELLR